MVNIEKCRAALHTRSTVLLGIPTIVQGLAVWRGAQARCDFAEALRFPAVLQCGAQQILQILLILLPSD